MSTNNENLNIIKNGLDAASPSLLTTKNEENIDEGIFQPFDTNNKSENEETQIKNGTDLSPKKNIEELIDEIEEDSNLLNLSVSARMISLKMLLKSKILTPGKSVMTVEYLVRVNTYIKIFPWAQLNCLLIGISMQFNSYIIYQIGPKVLWRPTGRWQNKISGNRSNFFIPECLGIKR